TDHYLLTARAQQLLELCDTGALVHNHDVVLGGRNPDVLELAHVVLDTGGAEELVQDQLAVEVADNGAILGRDVVHVISSQDTSGARHVLDDDGGIAGDVLADVASDVARIGIISAAGRGADDDADRLATVE